MEITPDNWENIILEMPLENVSVDTDADSDTVDVAPEPGGGSDTSDVGISEEVHEESDTVDASEESDCLEGLEQGESNSDQEISEGAEGQGPALSLPSSPFPVYLVDNPEETGIELYAVAGSAYPGTISSTYLSYFEGIADKLAFNEHYVIYRSGQSDYKMFWGENLEQNRGQFSGSDLNYCSIYTGTGSSNMTVSWGTDTLSLSAGTGYVYSDLGDYPSITKGGTGIETLALLFTLGFFIVYSVCHDIFDYVMEHVYRK